MVGVLISHCEEDRKAAEGLRSGLTELAVPEVADFVSLTRSVSEKPLGAEMTAAGALVVLLSKSARRDSRVMTEAGVAVSLGKPVVAVILDETEPEDLDFIEAQAWIPAAGRNPAKQLAHIVHQTLKKGTQC